MHAVMSDLHARARHQQLLEEAAHQRLCAHAARLPAVPLAVCLARRRRAIGYRLVEVGLRLALDHPPRP
jgi:hypothetical protein